jgi:hypothetical protein
MQDPNDHPYEDQGYDAPTLPYAPYGDDTLASPPTQPTGASGSAETPEPGNPLASQATPESDDPSAFQATSEQESTLILPPREDMPGIPGLPGGSGDTGIPPKKSRKGLWISLTIVGVLLVILIPVATFQILAYVNRSTPVKTLDTFCDALLHENYGTAYNQLSSNIQTQLSETDFAGSLSLDKVVVCKHGTANESSPRASTNLELVHSSQGINRDIVFLTKDKNNYWRIDDLQKQA